MSGWVGNVGAVGLGWGYSRGIWGGSRRGVTWGGVGNGGTVGLGGGYSRGVWSGGGGWGVGEGA